MTREEIIFRLNALETMVVYKDALGAPVNMKPYREAIAEAGRLLKGVDNTKQELLNLLLATPQKPRRKYDKGFIDAIAEFIAIIHRNLE